VPVAAAHVELDEGAGQLVLLPRRGMFAGTQPHDRIADAHRLPRLQRQVAADAVALVEQADDGDALRHRRAAGRQDDVGRRHRFDRLGRGRIAGGQVLRHDDPVGAVRRMQRAIAEHAGHDRGQQQDAGREPAPDPCGYHPSGVHAS